MRIGAAWTAKLNKAGLRLRVESVSGGAGDLEGTDCWVHGNGGDIWRWSSRMSFGEQTVMGWLTSIPDVRQVR